jgi:hypothetical protein
MKSEIVSSHSEAARHRDRLHIVRTLEETACIGAILLGVVVSLLAVVPPWALLTTLEAMRRALS